MEEDPRGAGLDSFDAIAIPGFLEEERLCEEGGVLVLTGLADELAQLGGRFVELADQVPCEHNLGWEWVWEICPAVLQRDKLTPKRMDKVRRFHG